MSDTHITSSRGTYTVTISRGRGVELMASAPLVIADRRVLGALRPTPDRAIITVDADEKAKTLSGCEAVLVQMHAHGLRRKDRVVVVGGGILQDVGTLVSSLYMRGVGWMFVPTTLTAMGDSCVGGKSSINVGGIKNLVGNIYPPESVVVDPDFLASLPLVDVVAGLAEMVKICYARGPREFEEFLGMAPAAAGLAVDDGTEALLLLVLEVKKWFVEVDEFDTAERLLLNFGHTFGHALEAACGFGIRHGVAVALGMMAALHHPRAMTSVRTAQLEHYCVELLRPIRPEIASPLDAVDWDEFERAISADKKGSSASHRLILPGEAGDLRVLDVERSGEAMGDLTTAMATAISSALG